MKIGKISVTLLFLSLKQIIFLSNLRFYGQGINLNQWIVFNAYNPSFLYDYIFIIFFVTKNFFFYRFVVIVAAVNVIKNDFSVLNTLFSGPCLKYPQLPVKGIITFLKRFNVICCKIRKVSWVVLYFIINNRVLR